MVDLPVAPARPLPTQAWLDRPRDDPVPHVAPAMPLPVHDDADAVMRHAHMSATIAQSEATSAKAEAGKAANSAATAQSLAELMKASLTAADNLSDLCHARASCAMDHSQLAGLSAEQAKQWCVSCQGYASTALHAAERIENAVAAYMAEKRSRGSHAGRAEGRRRLRRKTTVPRTVEVMKF